MPTLKEKDAPLLQGAREDDGENINGIISFACREADKIYGSKSKSLGEGGSARDCVVGIVCGPVGYMNGIRMHVNFSQRRQCERNNSIEFG